MFFNGVRARRCAWIAALLLLGCARGAWASSLNYCQGEVEPGAAVQDRLIQVAAKVKDELEGSGHTMALVARSGLALQRLDQRYSHAGVALKASANTPWSVRQLYYACDAQRPRIFDQGMAGFVLGAHDPAEGYISIVLLPPDPALALEQAALNDGLALQLLGAHYSANAYAFGLRYQNCNQWLAEMLALAWSEAPPTTDARSDAQAWLRTQDYQPSVLRLGWRPLVWLAGALPWLHNDDHPEEDLALAQFRVSMPESIERFVQARLPQSTHIELCYTEHTLVLHRGWEPIAAGCVAGPQDEVSALR